MINTAVHDEFDQVEQRITHSIDQIWSRHFGPIPYQPAEAWSPLVNVYQLKDRLDVCVDMAGLKPRSLQVRISPGRLTICGVRPTPDPRDDASQPMRIVSMEIDHGPFRRVIQISGRVDLKKVRTEYECGLLWIRMPIAQPG